MTFIQKQLLYDRLQRAYELLEKDYSKAQADAEKCHAYYYQNRHAAQDFHQQSLIILQALHDLWTFSEDDF